MTKDFFLLAICSTILFGCAAGESSLKKNATTEQKLSPGQCEVAAEVVKIDSTLSVGSENDPCSSAPCVAWIEIENVVSRGAGTNTIVAGDTLKAKFAFTLNPTTKETFPTLDKQLPGLSVGSHFDAIIQLLPSGPSMKEKRKTYLIYGYNKER